MTKHNAVRNYLPETRQSIVHKFCIGETEGYIIVGLYPNGQPGEIFLQVQKEGSTIGALCDAWAISISMALQYGVPLDKICKKFEHTRFEPSGHSTNKHIGHASSILDYVARWTSHTFIK